MLCKGGIQDDEGAEAFVIFSFFIKMQVCLEEEGGRNTRVMEWMNGVLVGQKK